MKRFHTIILLAALTLGGFALRAFRLDLQPLWWDEGYSIFFATRDFATMLERTAIDIHPPFYYALLQLWMIAAGKSDVAARWFSILIGTATIPLLYALALVIARNDFRDEAIPKSRFGDCFAASRLAMTSHRVALFAALLLALSPLHIYYSQQVRMYGLVTLLALASVYLFVRLLALPPGKPKTALVALAYILVTTAALYTQYYAAFIVAFQIIALVIFVIRHQPSAISRQPLAISHQPSAISHQPLAVSHQQFAIRNSQFAIHWLAIALLYLPWLVYAGPKLFAYVTAKVAIEQYAPLDPFTFLARHLAAFSIGHLTTWTALAWASVFLIAIAFLGFIAGARGRKGAEEKSPALLVSLSLLVPLALGYLVNLVYPFHPIHGERLLLFAAPAFYLLVAFGIDALWKRRARFGALAVIGAAILSAFSLADFYNVPRYPKDDYRPLIAEMQTLAQPGDKFLAIYPWQTGYLEAYYTGAPLNITEVTINNWQLTIDNCQLLIVNCRMWLPALQTQGRILEDALDRYLRERAYSVLDHWHGTTRLELFAFAADPPLPRAPRNIVFEDNTTLGDLAISREPLTAGQDIARIRFVGALRVPAMASFRLLDRNGTVWAQSDRELARDWQRIGLAIPPGTPPGEYDLRVTAYRAGDRARLRLKDSAEESAALATLDVIASARPNLAALPHRAQIDFENGMRLVGYDAPRSARPGFATPLTLFWQTTRALDRAYVVVTQVQDARGTVVAATQAAPARNIHPPTGWRIGELVRDPQTLLLRGDPPDGEYRIAVALLDPATGVRTAARAIGTIRVQGRARYFGAPTPAQPFDARLDDLARLVGYDLNDDARALRLVLYWRALASSEISYTVFVHLVDANGALLAQADQIPGAGAYPTTTWVEGEYLVDVYDLARPPGAYAIRIGMYDATTGARLPAFDANGQLIGDSIQVR